MSKIIFFLLLLCSPVYAEKFICFDATSKAITSVRQGDCKDMGLCSGFNNEGLQLNCIFANDIEWNSIEKYKKIDITSVTGNRVVNFTQAEKDALDAAEAQAIIDAKIARQNVIDDKFNATVLGDMTLAKIDAKINAIANLGEAKTFLKLLVRGIIKLNGGE